jgi:hypothetical protein
MWLIRKEQLAALGAAHRERFVAKALADLAHLFPGDPRLENELEMRAMVEGAIGRAAAYGIDGAREVSLFVYLVHELGPGFEDAPERRWMKALLGDASMPASARLDVIYARLAVAATADPS